MPDDTPSKPVAFPDVAKLMTGKRGLIMGVANERSIAWGIAQALHAAGAELAFTYQGAAFGKRVIPMVEKLGSKIVVEADVENEQSLQALFSRLQRDWGKLDFVVHAIAFSDKEELKGRYVDTTKANFQRSLTISCYSFTEIARLALPLMSDGGSLITLTYEGATRVMPSYNVMDVAKAALEAKQIDAIVVDLPTALYISAVEIEGTKVVGQFPAEAGGTTDEFGMVFDLDSPLVECVNAALATLKDGGKLAEIEQQWLSDKTGAPVIATE